MTSLTWTTIEPEGDGPNPAQTPAPTLAILHGLFGSRRNWSQIARRLAPKGWRVLLADLRNHGDSDWADSMTYPEMAGDVAAWLDEVAPMAPVVLAGHSMGGKVAMRLALERPDRLTGLAVVDVAPVAYGGGRGLEDVMAALQAMPLDGLTRRAEADARLAEHLPDPGLRAFLLQNLLPAPRHDPDGMARWRFNLPVLADSLPMLSGWPAPPRGARFDRPTLVLAGGESDYVRTKHEDPIQALFPAAEIKRVAGAGHWLHAEKPDAAARVLASLLDRCAP
jgi:pimeloyl-ACP methyl ester carboxylesterase